MINDFNYLRPKNLEEALEFLSQYKDECKIICGGQSLLIIMRQGLIAPEYLIDIKHLKELDYIEFDPEKGLRIGATTTHRSIEKSSLIKEKYPVLVEMEKKLASVQTRNWGTIGGNLAHGDPASDPATTLIALGASVKVGSKRGERVIPLEEFFVDYFETVLEEDEMILEVQVPPPPPRTGTTFEKFTIIEAEMGIVSVATSVTLEEDGKTCKAARIALGGAAPTPLRAKKAEGILIGKELNDEIFEEAGRIASEECEPISDIHASEEYRRHLVSVLTKRLLKSSMERAKSQQ